jgi:hypothetical protein
MAKALFAAILALALLTAPAVRAETLTNDQIVELTGAGLGAEAIVAKIRTSESRFDVSTGALVALKRQNVSDEVIAAMIAAATDGAPPGAPVDQNNSPDPTAPHDPGVYLLKAASGPARMRRLDPTLADGIKTANAIGWIFTYGIVPLKVTTVLAGPAARLKADTSRPTFYFYFNQPGSGLYQNGLGILRLEGPAPTPGLFTLMHFETVGANRQALTQQIGVGNANAAVKSLIAFSFSQVEPGVFKVTTNTDLPPGEYAFVCSPYDPNSEDSNDRYFDFSVPAAPPASPTLSAAP